MTKCPNCKKRAEPRATYCSGCHIAFPSNTKTGSLRLSEGTTWKVPSLFFVALLGGWFVQIDANDGSAEPGSYQALARDAKRTVIDWVAEYTGFAPA